MSKATWRWLVLGVVGLVAVPLALPALAGAYGTVAVYQASGTPNPPADGDSPFTSCDISGFAQSSSEVNYVNTEDAPSASVDPTDSSTIIGVYQQDQWSNSRAATGLVAGVTHDGGQTWAATWPHFSICAGGTAGNGGDYQRAAEPGVAFSPNGAAYFIGRSINLVGPGLNAVLVSKSTDGGDHWGGPVTLVRNNFSVSPFYNNVSTSITSAPFDSNYVYAAWSRFRKPGDAQSSSAEHTFAFMADAMFARTTDGGQTWEQPRAIVMYRSNSGTLGNQVAVLPDGTLVDVFDNVQSASHQNGFDIKVIRSTDRGVTWSDPIEVAPENATPCKTCNGPVDPDTGAPIRVGLGRPDLAVDRNPSSAGYGNIYAVWGDTYGSSKKTPYPTVVFTRSTDGGLTWSPLIKANKSPAGVQAFTPSVDVASDGTVGVTYYDFRNNTPDPGLPTDYWMIHCHPATDCTDPANWAENHVAGSFDIERAPSLFRGYYLGEFAGLTSSGNSFLPFFAQTTATDRANTYLGVVTP